MKNKVKKDNTPNSILIYSLKSYEVDGDDTVCDPTVAELVFDKFVWLVFIKPVYLSNIYFFGSPIPDYRISA